MVFYMYVPYDEAFLFIPESYDLVTLIFDLYVRFFRFDYCLMPY